jgi:nucleotide-binding universal stress UspA family protein
MAAPALTLKRVLCATDLSDFGNRAVDVAFAAVAPGGSVTLVYVVHEAAVPSPLVPHYGKRRPSSEELAEQGRRAGASLRALAESASKRHEVSFDVRTPRAANVTEALLAEAERIDADLICLATHSRTGLIKLVLGSAAHEVLVEAGRPVLLVPSPLDS